MKPDNDCKKEELGADINTREIPKDVRPHRLIFEPMEYHSVERGDQGYISTEARGRLHAARSAEVSAVDWGML